tara:strand:+ start:2273 stop:2704 length:432 start_codon:yes stop_codon:yes gene_type:complete
MSKIIYTNSDGSVSIIHPTGDVNNAIKDVPSGLSYEIVEDSAIPTDRSFRNAWKQNSKTIETDMAKAKEIHKTNIRNARTPKLAELDIEFQKALETSASTTDIVSKKQALRDAPADSAIASADTEAKLKAQWNTSILGTSPYS